MNLKLNFRFSIPSEWTLYELQQAQKHAWRRQPAPTSAWSEPRCRSCHETKISQKWDILPKSGISHQKWDIPPKSGISHQKWDIPLWTGISTGLGYLTLGWDISKAGYPAVRRDIPPSPISRRVLSCYGVLTRPRSCYRATAR